MKRWIIILIAIAAAITAYNFGSAAAVSTEAVKRGNIRELIELEGRVELDKSDKIYARLEGFIDEINADEGDEVSKGFKLMQLSVEDVNFAISKAEASYKAAFAQLESLKKSIKPEHVELTEAELEQARAMEKAAFSDYSNKQYNYENIKVLYNNGAVSEKEMKDAETLLDASEGSFRNAEQMVRIAQYNLDIIEDGVSKENIRAAEAGVEAAKAQLDELVKNKGKTTVCSPIKGIVLSKEVEKDQAVMPGMFMYEIGDYDSAYIRADVLVDDIAKISKGQKAIISGDILENVEIQGEVYYIAPKAESRISSLGIEQQRIEIRINFNNDALNLKPGYTMDVDIALREKQDTLYVPDKSVFAMDGKDAVFVVKNNKLELRSIETGIENDDNIEVISGITEGESVVFDPDSELKPGKRVKVKNNT